MAAAHGANFLHHLAALRCQHRPCSCMSPGSSFPKLVALRQPWGYTDATKPLEARPTSECYKSIPRVQNFSCAALSLSRCIQEKNGCSRSVPNMTLFWLGLAFLKGRFANGFEKGAAQWAAVDLFQASNCFDWDWFSKERFLGDQFTAWSYTLCGPMGRILR